MDVALLQQQLIAHIENLQREGYVSAYLKICYRMKECSNVTFFVDLIATFLTESAATIYDMSETLQYPILDYDKLLDLAIKLKGSSVCIGACRISDGCYELQQAILERSWRDCKRVVEMIKSEKSTWEIKLESIMQLEREIIYRQML